MKKHSEATHVPRFRRWSRARYAVFASLHRYVTIGVLAVGMSILLPVAEKAAAQQADTITLIRDVSIESVEVVGSKHSPSRSILSQTPVFKRDNDAAPLPTLEAALRVTPSIDVRERSGKGAQADISVRGGSFDQTMIQLNGINFTDARTGHQSHSLPIDIDCIGDISLVEGVSGVGAYAGAVNIRTAPLYPTYLRLSTEVGQYGYFYSNLSGAISRKKFAMFAACSYRRSDGYIFNTDFSNVNGYVRATYDSPKAGFFDVQLGVQGREFGSNGFYAAYNRNQAERTSTALGSLRWVKEIGRVRLTADVSYRKNFDRYDWIRGTAMNYHNTDNIGAELWSDVRWKGGVTSLGGDYIYNHIFSTNLGETMATPHGRYKCAKERHVGNIWMRHIYRRGAWSVGAGAGLGITPYGTAAMWNITGGWTRKDWTVEIGATQSMRLPTFTDLYYSSAAQLNNLALRPEQAITYQVKGGYSHDKWHASAMVFWRDGRNVIDWVWRSEVEVDGIVHYNKWHAEQSSRLGTAGVEIEGGYVSSEGVVRRAVVSYGYLTTTKLHNVQTSSVMDYMQNKLSACLGLSIVRDLTATFTGTLYDRFGGYNAYLRDENDTLLRDENGQMLTEYRAFKPYFLLNVRLRYEIGPVAIHVDMENMTNTRYCDFGGLRRPGFWITGGFTLTIR